MGFLKFKKKEEFPSFSDLDLPPEPPAMFKASEDKLPDLSMPADMPKAIDDFELPELPPLDDHAAIDFKDMPPVPEVTKEKKGFFSFLKAKKAPEELNLPDIPPMEEKPMEITPPEMEPSTPEDMPPVETPDEEPQPIAPAPIEAPKPVRTEGMVVKRFLKLDEFRNVQDNVADAKAIFRDSDALFLKLDEISLEEEKGYTSLLHSLRDIQTKIMYFDKSLFKEV